MILYVPGVSENPWIDATDDGLDLTRFVPASLAARQALVLDPDNPRFEKIPSAPPTRVRIDREATLDAGGKGLSVEETISITGEYASWLRAWFLDTPGSEHPALVRRAWDEYGNVEVKEVSLTNVQDSSKPFEARVKYTVSDAFDPATGQLSVPFFWERDYLVVKPVENRRSPFEIQTTLELESHTRLQGVPGLGASAMASLAAEGKTIAGQWQLKPESLTGAAIGAAFPTNAETGGPGLKLAVTVLQGHWTAAQWPEFQQGRRVLTDKLKRSFLTLSTPVITKPAASGH